MELCPTNRIFSKKISQSFGMRQLYLEDIKLKTVSLNQEIIFLNDCVIRLAKDVGDIKLKIISANDSAEAKPFIKMIKPHITLIHKIYNCIISVFVCNRMHLSEIWEQ